MNIVLRPFSVLPCFLSFGSSGALGPWPRTPSPSFGCKFARLGRALPTMPPWVHRTHATHPFQGVRHVHGVPRVAWWAALFPSQKGGVWAHGPASRAKCRPAHGRPVPFRHGGGGLPPPPSLGPWPSLSPSCMRVFILIIVKYSPP